MPYSIPDPHYEELLLPGVKPVGNVVIDRSNKYGKHVIRAFVPAQGVALDILNGPLSPTGNPVVEGNGNITLDGDDWYTYSNATPVLTEFTIILKAKRSAASQSNDGLYSDKNISNWGNTQGISLNQRSATGSYMFVVGNSTDYIYSDVPIGAYGTWFDMAAVWKASTTQEVYIDSVLTSHLNVGSPPSASYTASTANSKIGQYYSTAGIWAGEMEYMFVLDKCLSASQVAEFHKDPYQTLIPA